MMAQKNDVQVSLNKVNGTVYMLEGKGGNIAFCLGKESVLMVDSQFADMSEKISTALKTITDLPVAKLVNTHWHGDHTGGNENFANQGAQIISHNNVRKRLSTEQNMKAFNRIVPAAPRASWPKQTFNDESIIYHDEEEIFIFHVENAHTDGDVMVYFTSSNVLHMGDTYFKGKYPFIDLGSGGSIQGYINALDQAIFVADEETLIIPGHGKLSNKDELVSYRKTLATIKSRIVKAIELGMSLEEIKEKGFTKEFDASYGTGFISPDSFVDTIWTDLSRGE